MHKVILFQKTLYITSFASKFRQFTLTTDIFLFGRTKPKNMACPVGPLKNQADHSLSWAHRLYCYFSDALTHLIKLQRKRKMDDLTSSLEEMTNRKRMLSESVMKAKVGKEETVSNFSLVSSSK